MNDNKNTPKVKGIRTAYQTIAGGVVAFFAGLWAIDGVSEYVTSQGPLTVLGILGGLGVSAGLISFLQNSLGK